ncbi:MAG: tryptophan 7-halogenase [Thiolinea sp.]
MEYASEIINSVWTGTPSVIYGNVANKGYIQALPENCAVEVPCLVDRNGIQPTRIEHLPPQLAAIMRMSTNVQELTVQALLTENREHIYHAAMLDPHTGAELDLDQIWEMVDELIVAHGDWLPDWVTEIITTSGGTMEHKPVRLVIVGGGTAGWLAALLLQAEGKRQGLHLDITLIESSRVPTIGVGEGTTAILVVCWALDIAEAEFLAKTDTIKYGIRHRELVPPRSLHDGPIDDAYALAERLPAAGSWLDTFCVAAGRSVAEPHVFTALMACNKAPVAQVQGRQIPVSRFQHAYHFDQAKVGAYLRSKAGEITTLDALVQAAERDPESGQITALQLDNSTQLQGDFFIDCTGFRRSLIRPSWTFPGSVMAIPCRSAIALPFWLDLQEDQPCPPSPTPGRNRPAGCGRFPPGTYQLRLCLF